PSARSAATTHSRPVRAGAVALIGLLYHVAAVLRWRADHARSEEARMRLPRDRFEYSAIRDRRPWKLPRGARIAVWTIVNVEDWDIEKPMPRQVIPAPAGATVLPDVPNWAWHDYGMRVGFWRLHAALAKRGIRATTAINASVCTAYPPVARAMLDAGGELMGHGLVRGALRLLREQRAATRRSVQAPRALTGRQPLRGPGHGRTGGW